MIGEHRARVPEWLHKRHGTPLAGRAAHIRRLFVARKISGGLLGLDWYARAGKRGR
jgi:hypothetical protein